MQVSQQEKKEEKETSKPLADVKPLADAKPLPNLNLDDDSDDDDFFDDDDFEHMAFSVVANWGEIGSTTIRIFELCQLENHPIINKNDEIL